jgi:Uma2 family endonuclease
MDGSTPTEPVNLPRHRFTADDVAMMVAAGVLGDRTRVELIGGELIDMPPEGAPHWAAKQKIVSWMLRRLAAIVDLAPDGPLRLGAADEPEPDLYLFPTGRDVNAVRGPDTLLVVEIADTSLSRDLVVKAPIYAAHGVRLYWVIDLAARVTLVHTLAGEGYGQPERVAFDAPLMVPGIAETVVLATLLPAE